MGALRSRMAQELKQLERAPPPGVCAWPVEDRMNELAAQLCGPKGTVYEEGVFKLSVHLPERYPFEPPKVRFLTPVYHPNIDSGGRICLDILNMPPKGGWRPSLNVCTVLASIGLLLAEPNPDDGLQVEVTHEYKHNREAFDAHARAMTRQHAGQGARQATDKTPKPSAGLELGSVTGCCKSNTTSSSSSSSSSGEDDDSEASTKRQKRL